MVEVTRYVLPSEQMIAKHGRFTCVLCRSEGEKVYGLVPTRRKSISHKKEYCACEKHVAEMQELERDREERNSIPEKDSVLDLMHSWGV